MGSLNPVFILPHALEERGEAFAKGLCGSVTLGVGQFCTNPGLVLGLDGGPMDKFITSAESSFSQTAPATMLNPGIRDAYESGLATFGKTEGVALLSKSATDVDASKTQAGAHVWTTDIDAFSRTPELSEEVFGPTTLVVRCKVKEELLKAANQLEGHLTATIHGTEEDLAEHKDLVEILERKVGRIIFNGFPTGVEVCHSMHHGGPYPATTDGRSTSVGTAAIFRFTRLVCFQGFPQNGLPDDLKDANPNGIWRLVDGEYKNSAL
jgi:NADP-dependent aldehyde dehydrogenase